MLLFGGRVVWKHDAFGPPAWGGGVEGVRVGAELFVVRVVVSVLASVLASAVSDCEGGIGTVRARQWCACGHERWLGWFVRLLQAREQVCYVGCYPCKTRSVIVTWCARCGAHGIMSEIIGIW